MIARHPHAANMMGEKLTSRSPWYEVTANGGGSYRTPGYVDGIARVVSLHPLHDYPLVVTVTISEDAALADWRRQAMFIAIGACVTIVAFALLFRAFVTQSRRLERSEATLEAGRVRLEHQTVELAAVADALRESEARFRDFAQISSDWLWETDENHRYCFMSDHIRAIGQSPESRIGRTRLELAADAESEPAKWQAHLALLDRHEPFRDFVYTRKFGAEPEPIISVSGKPLFDPSGRFLGHRGVGRDITKEVLAERSLREAKAAAEAANLAKSQFLANMSHELRTPLNAILGFSEMIKLGMTRRSQSRQEEYAALIHHSGEHLLAIIGDVLDLAKVDAGKLELHEEECIDPCAIVKACVALMEETANAGGLRLSVNVDPSLPLIVADATRLKQILLNLLSNAVKFSDPGGSVITTLRQPEPDTIAFEVRDTGVGMSTAEIAIALEPFGQVDAAMSRRNEGTGLGLPLARRLAELHGGSLHIDSEKGRGTTITVTLPATRVLADTVESTDPLSATASAAHVL
jgi:PAS domain S-box-containing protein